MSAFATTNDLERFWRPLSGDERSRASDLLDYASAKLRLMAEGSGKDLDDTDLSDTYKDMLKYTVLEATKRAMSAPELSGGAESYSQTAGPYSENYKFANPNGDLYFTKKEIGQLGLSAQFLRSLSTARRDIYGDYDDLQS